MKKLPIKKVGLSLITSVLVCSFVFAPLSQTLEVRRAEAFGDANSAWQAAQFAKEAGTFISSMTQSGLMASLNIKEFTLDGIAWALGNILLKEMIRSTTKWVNSGFKGSPAFVSDLNGFLLNIADKVAGNFIYGAGLGMLCSPFKLNIQVALEMSYNKTRGYQAQCRLSQVVKNMDRFLGGDFAQGGWNGWYEVALGSSNPYTTKFEAETAMYASISNAQGQQIKLLDFGKGFLSMTQPGCDSNMGPCPITTPGAVIESQLNDAISLPGKRLAVADELNELVGALFSQLAGQVLGGVGGLLGLTEPSYGSGDYFSRMDGQRDTLGYASSAIKPLEDDIANEKKVASFNSTIVNMILDARAYRERTYPARTVRDSDTGEERTVICTPGDLTPSLSQSLSNARREIASTTVIINELSVLYSDYTLLRNTSTDAPTIASLRRKYSATTIPMAESDLMEKYGGYRTSNRLHGIDVLVSLEYTAIPALQNEISAFKTSIDNACRRYDSSPG